MVNVVNFLIDGFLILLFYLVEDFYLHKNQKRDT